MSARPRFAARFPLHVTLRMREGVWKLRTRRCFSALRRAFAEDGERFGVRIVHYSMQGNHIHLLAEAAGKEALSRGMLADDCDARILRTPREVSRVRNYLLRNAEHHYGLHGADPFASIEAVRTPRSWLLRRHC